jgi:hypothetical protein
LSKLDEIVKKDYINRWSKLQFTGKEDDFVTLPIEDLAYLIDRCRKLEKVAEAAKGLQPISRECANDYEYEDKGFYYWEEKLLDALKALDEPK